ncbi:hypothetical protein [Mucilaginibacter sp. OK098]|uniref:hypothetical protein n=1 Tax=Mucilaginibacter sp. OK098 TaxID=1855297 RepID=UPI000916C68F|nr:hypothetical protein [Mucilaginibacter sp. OK098]SHL98474.1 hypothetical protein SAMN05216524_101416 [Mucilaginibacter sp. OK098]
MIKASALYIVIVIALVIGLLCSSLIVAAYLYRIQYQRKFRQDQLENNISSGTNILLNSTDTSFTREKTFSLFSNEMDSVSIQRIPWGVYDIGTVKAFAQRDTLFKSFSFANTIDSTKWAALYLIDEDRPFSLSGKTTIRGDAYIPKAGVQAAYIDNKAYEGDKRFIIGTKHNSERKLPPLDEKRLKQFEQYFTQANIGDSTLSKKDSLQNSFLRPTHVFNFKKTAKTIENIYISGNVILFSDTTLTIDSTAVFKNIQAYARAIIVKSGFHGSCQLFATDSIRVEQNCELGYPSCLGVLRFKSPVVNFQAKVSMGKNVSFNGLIFTYDKMDSQLKPLIIADKNVKITGQIYSQGIVQLNDKSEIDGSVFTSRFWYKNSFTLFENYLINATINSKALSPYYLSSGLLPVSGKKKKVLQWLEAN